MSDIHNSDAAALLGRPDSEFQAQSIYRVYFDLLIEVEDSDDPIKLSDSLDTLAGVEARDAQQKVEEFVLNSGKYKITPIEFYITGTKRLATTEI
jgi:hypothetical protein